jgi:hypothetical protein
MGGRVNMDARHLNSTDTIWDAKSLESLHEPQAYTYLSLKAITLRNSSRELNSDLKARHAKHKTVNHSALCTEAESRHRTMGEHFRTGTFNMGTPWTLEPDHLGFSATYSQPDDFNQYLLQAHQLIFKTGVVHGNNDECLNLNELL